MIYDIDFIRDMVDEDMVNWTTHCILRMEERKINTYDVHNCIKNGEIIENYPIDKPDPSCLVFGLDVNGQFLHVVVAINLNKITIITTYHPDNNTFEDDFKTRKR